MHYYIVYGLRRSGNHAIINWMFANHKGRVFYKNDLLDNPRESIDEALDATDAIICFNKNPEIYPGALDEKLDLVIVSFENRDPFFYNDPGGDEILRRLSPNNPDIRRSNLIIIRDYFNFMASTFSCLEKGGKHDFIKNRGGDITKESFLSDMWNKYIDITQSSEDFGLVIYDRWVSDRSYRNDLADKFGFVNTDAGMAQVSNYGFGSSFEAGEPAQMKFHERWKIYRDNPAFMECLRLDTVTSNYLKLFGETEAFKHFRK